MQALSGSGRRLHTKDTLRPLKLPPCDFGPLLNYWGSFAGDACPAMGWSIVPLNASLPDNLWEAQKAARQAVLAAAAVGR